MPRCGFGRVLVALAAVAVCAAGLRAGPREDPPPGMSAYVMVLLKQAPGASAASDDRALMAAHLASLRQLVIAGDAVAVGPMADDGEIRGIILFRDMPLETARSIAERDPTVKAGKLVVEAHPWWGTKGIGAGYAERAKATPLEQLPFASYQIGFLRRGPKWTATRTPEIEKLQEAHLAHINAMAQTGKLVVAGPFTDDTSLRGVFLFRATPEEAQALAAEDPLVKVDRLVLDLHPWMTSEGVIP